MAAFDFSALVAGANRGLAQFGAGRAEREQLDRTRSQEDEVLERRRRADALAESIRAGELDKAAQEQARLRAQQQTEADNLTTGISAAEARLPPDDVAAIGGLTGQARLDALNNLETRQQEVADATLAQQRAVELRGTSSTRSTQPTDLRRDPRTNRLNTRFQQILKNLEDPSVEIGDPDFNRLQEAGEIRFDQASGGFVRVNADPVGAKQEAMAQAFEESRHMFNPQEQQELQSILGELLTGGGQGGASGLSPGVLSPEDLGAAREVVQGAVDPKAALEAVGYSPEEIAQILNGR